jgi:hypothetical protein
MDGKVDEWSSDEVNKTEECIDFVNQVTPHKQQEAMRKHLAVVAEDARRNWTMAQSSHLGGNKGEFLATGTNCPHHESGPAVRFCRYLSDCAEVPQVVGFIGSLDFNTLIIVALPGSNPISVTVLSFSCPAHRETLFSVNRRS